MEEEDKKTTKERENLKKNSENRNRSIKINQMEDGLEVRMLIGSYY